MATPPTTLPVSGDGSTSTIVPAAPVVATDDTPTPPSTITPAPPAGIPAGIPPASLPIALQVSFTLNTTDGLRQISLGLEKDTDGINTNWKLTFVLLERSDPSVDFGLPVISLNVFLATHLQANAEFAAHNGMNDAQAAHASGPAADAAKAASEGTLPFPIAQRVAANTFA